MTDSNWHDFWEHARNADILEVAGRLFGAKLKRSGADWVGACPNGCAKTDGFVVSPKKGKTGFFLCRPSGASGDVIKMVAHVKGYSAIEAGEWITGRGRPDHTRDDTSEERDARLAMDAHRHEEEQRREAEQQQAEEAKGVASRARSRSSTNAALSSRMPSTRWTTLRRAG